MPSVLRYIATLLLLLIASHTIPVLSQGPERFDPNADDAIIDFAFITDTHKWGPSADIRYADSNIRAFVDYCNANPSIQFALHGGDFMNAYNTCHEQALFCLQSGLRDFAGLQVPFYTTKGNHDCNGKQRTADRKPDNTQIVTDHEYYQIFSPLSSLNPLRDTTGIVVDSVRPEGNYYYRDFPRQRFRLIVLNDYDLDSLEYYDYHGAQMKWLAERALDFTAKADPTEWCFLILGHGFGYNMFTKPISRLLHAYTQGQDFADENRGYSYHCAYDKMPRAQLVALLGGHNHEDLYSNPDDYNIIHVNRGFATGGEVGVPGQEICFDHFRLDTRKKTLTEQRIGRGRSYTYSYGPGRLLSPLPTFPEAMGMGGLTHGGAHGREIWVTNLNDSGHGSLRWAVSQRGNRMVCFRVSGTIHLQSPIIIDNDSLSICGHSAPGQGITLQGHSVNVLASDVILRYLHLRNCPLTDGNFGQHSLMLDHLSCSFSQGPAIAIRRAQNVTVQNCLVSHTASVGIEAGGYMATYYHNLVTSCPEAIHVPDQEGQNRWIHLYRNVIHNWASHCMHGGGCGGEVTIEENYLLPGPATTDSLMLTVAADGTGRYYTNNNGYLGREYIRDQWSLVHDHYAIPYNPVTTQADLDQRLLLDPVARALPGGFESSCLVIAAFHYRGLFTRPTKVQTYRESLLWAGCSLQRDSYDQALIQALRQGLTLGNAPDGLFTGDVRALGGYPSIPVTRHNPRYTQLAKWLDERAQADRSIVLIYDNSPHLNVHGYPLVAGYHDAFHTDSCDVALLAMGNFLTPPAPTSAADAPDALADSSIVSLMRLTRYDVVLPGINEFTRQPDQLIATLQPFGTSVVSCNLTSPSQRSRLAFQPYVIRQFGRHTIAFIGVTRSVGVARAQIIHQVQGYIDRARHEGAERVILLTSLGDGNASTHSISVAQLVAGVHGVDVVIDGEPSAEALACQHLSDARGHDVIVSRAGHGFSTIGKVIIAPDGLITSQLVPMSNLRFKSRSVSQKLEQLLSTDVSSQP